MLKILHVETGMHLYGGAQQVAYLMEGLAQRGCDNVLVCPPGAAIGKHFAGSAVRVHEVPCGGDLDLGFVTRLRRVLRLETPQLVHLHSRRGADMLGGMAARREHIPVVLSRRVDNREAPWLARWKYRRYDRVVCISQGIAEVLKSEGVDASCIRVVRSAVVAEPWTHPESRAAFGAEFDVPENVLLIGVVAQLIERKGHRVLFEALRQLTAGLPPFVVVIFGQGPMRETLEAEAQVSPLSGHVRFAGFRQDLARWMGCLDLLIHPALMEGLGVSLLQASAAGVPIIASRAGGIPEAVHDGINGVLVPPGDASALAGVLDSLLRNPGWRQQLGASGRQLATTEFSIDAMVEGNLRVYRELLS